MRHRNHKYHLSRPTGHRFALLRNLTIALLKYERILTTVTKAKALKMYVEPLITLSIKNPDAKTGEGIAARRQAFSVLQDNEISKKLFNDIAARYVARYKKLEEEKKFGKGGYTRIIRTGNRAGDGADMAYIELVERVEKEIKRPKKKKEAMIRPQM